MNTSLINAQWLYEHLNTPGLIVLDASMSRVIGITPLTYSQRQVIPGSHPLDLEGDLVNPASAKPHAWPERERLINTLESLGITPDSEVVIYDDQGIYSAPRAWWMLRSAGINKVKVLNGGLPAWLEAGYPVAADYAQSVRSSGLSDLPEPAGMLTPCTEVLRNCNSPRFTLVDVRSAERFRGEVPEPREGVRSGHIPGSLNLPFTRVLNERAYLPVEKISGIFTACGLQQDTPLVFSCGSGVTACIVLLGAYEAGWQQVSLYDGSWAEWGSDHALPLEK